jgi:mannonate dehydratase
MKSGISRRNVFKGITTSVLAPALLPIAAAAQSGEKPFWMGNGMPQEGPDTPKIATGINLGFPRVRPRPGEEGEGIYGMANPSAGSGGGHANPAGNPPAGGQGVTDEAIRGVVQLGVYHVLGGGPSESPWEVSTLQPAVDKLKAAGVTLGNLAMNVPPHIIYGRPGRDDEIDRIRQSIQAAGKVGVPVVEYNFYAHRAMEAYFDEPGRGGAGIQGVDYDRMKGLPPLPQEGAHNLTEMWANITYFLKAVIPTAEKANVRMALHPNDPPVPLSRGSQQIMGSVAGWKHLIEIVNSPSNGITFDCGVTREMGEDPVAVCRYFGTRDRINHMHFRGPHVITPYVKYVEGFLDDGDVNLFAVMRELIKVKYTRELYPEHPRVLDYDRARGHSSYAADAYDIGYGKAMFQAALIVERG